MSVLARLFPRRRDPRSAARPLYRAVIAEARRPAWYAEAHAPDTFDGRFDMVTAVLSLVLLRLERDGAAGAEPSARVTELFVDDMDGQLRERGIGDLIVGKHIGKMMAALGGRLTAYRAGLAGDDAALADALVRNLWRGEAPADGGIAAAAMLRALERRLADMPLDELLAGRPL